MDVAIKKLEADYQSAKEKYYLALRQRAKALKAGGLLVPEIAGRLGISRESVYYYLREDSPATPALVQS